MSDIGGTLGLWLGFSLLTTFEFIELLVDSFIWGLLCLINMRTRTSTTQGQQRARGGSNNSSEPNRGDVELEDLETVTRGYQEEEEGDVFARASGGAEGAAPLSPPPSYSDTMDASVNWEKRNRGSAQLDRHSSTI